MNTVVRLGRTEVIMGDKYIPELGALNLVVDGPFDIPQALNLTKIVDNAIDEYQRLAAEYAAISGPPGLGHIYVLTDDVQRPADQEPRPDRWVVVRNTEGVDPPHLFLAPLERDARQGRCDVCVSGDVYIGRGLIIRLLSGLWIPSQWLENKRRDGCVGADVIDNALTVLTLINDGGYDVPADIATASEGQLWNDPEEEWDEGDHSSHNHRMRFANEARYRLELAIRGGGSR